MEKMINVIECGAEKERRLPEHQRRGLIDVGCGGWRQDESGQNCAPVCWCRDPEMRREERNVVAFGCHFLSGRERQKKLCRPSCQFGIGVNLVPNIPWLLGSSAPAFRNSIPASGLLGFRDIRTARCVLPFAGEGKNAPGEVSSSQSGLGKLRVRVETSRGQCHNVMFGRFFSKGQRFIFFHLRNKNSAKKIIIKDYAQEEEDGRSKQATGR